MAMTPAYALAHVFLPNLLKLKGHASVIAAIDRRDMAYLDPLWTQAHVAHTPVISSQMRDPYRVATVSFPTPAEIGEAFMAGIVIKPSDPPYLRYFTLEHDYVLAKKANRTVLCERQGQKHTRISDGPALTGDPAADARAFVDCFMELIVPTKVTRK